ncbi:NAD(P)H-hydrate dehydratase [Candidatus Micrarchaeota archaeon]|nr:NAD(P)H-hydrate dehydratase [Candidatus Micrarchaeota archaeon]
MLKEPKKDSHKGENGKLAIVAGGKEYHGALLFAIEGAKRFVDLIYVIKKEWASGTETALRSIPEIIIRNKKMIKECDAVLIGPGVGKNFNITPYLGITKTVIDGDGLNAVTLSQLRKTIITPHEEEFQRLFGIKGTKENVTKMAKKHGCTILKKGKEDIISDGKTTLINKTGNEGLTKGGTGDILAGITAAFFTRNDALSSAYAGACILGKAGDLLYKEKKWVYGTSEISSKLSEAYLQFRKER